MIFRMVYKQLSYRRETAPVCISYGEKWKTPTGRQYLRTLYVDLQLARKAIKFGEKRQIKAITPFKVILDHRGRHQSKARLRLPISD